jgi:hypothetical protein
LLTLLLRTNVPELNVHCFAFAPPPVVSRELSEKCEKFVHSFVLEDDIVPRLSYGSMCDLLEHVKLQRKDTPGSVFSVFRNVMMKDFGAKNFINKTDGTPKINTPITKNDEQKETITKTETEEQIQTPLNSPSLQHLTYSKEAPSPTNAMLVQPGEVTKDNESPSVVPSFMRGLFSHQPVEIISLPLEKKNKEKLFLTGSVFHLFDRKQRLHLQKKFSIPIDSLRSAEQIGGDSLSQLASENLDVGKATNLEDFHEIALSRRMFAVHMPYEVCVCVCVCLIWVYFVLFYSC